MPPIGRPISPSSTHWRARLVRAAEERVGRAADAQAPRRGRVDQTARLGERDAERLFRMDVLAGRDRLQADLDMRLRHREVEDDLDRRVGENRVDRARGKAEFGRARLRRRGIDVRQATMSRIGNFFAAVR